MSDLRHVDVAVLYGQGQKDRAQAIARKLRMQKSVGDLAAEALDNNSSSTVDARQVTRSRL